jgi:hypothetical protein
LIAENLYEYFEQAEHMIGMIVNQEEFFVEEDIWKILRTDDLYKLCQNQHNSELRTFTLIFVAFEWSHPVHFAKKLMKVLTEGPGYTLEG